MKRLNKTGQVMQNIGALGVGIATLTIVLIIAFLLMSNVRTQSISQASPDSVTNESVAWVYNTWTALDFSPNSMELGCSTVYSNSSPVAISNYVCGTSGINMSNTTFVNATTLVSYSYKDRSTAFNSTEDLTNATATIPGWVSLIILVIIGGIILVLVAAFKRK